MITELTPTMVLLRGSRGKSQTLADRARWIIRMHTRRLAQYDIRDDVRQNLEHEVEIWKQKLTEL